MNTHYHRESKLWFNVDTCEICGCDTVGPNACTVVEEPAFRFYKVLAEVVPPTEIYYSEALDSAVCEDCYE
jgi:hypothetical protein